MKATIESTTKIVTLCTDPGGHMKVRVWEGTTEAGVKCHFYIVRVAVDQVEDTSVFDRELQECRPPSVEVQEIPAKLVL